MPHIGARIERSLGTDMRNRLFRGRGISKQYLILYHGGGGVRMDSPLALSAAILWGMHKPKEKSSERVDYDQFLPRNGLFGSLQRLLKH